MKGKTMSGNSTITKTIGRWRLRRRADGTHYAEDGTTIATFTEADKLFELSAVDPTARRTAFVIPTAILGELLAEELARGPAGAG
jgi:hypothetical protein